MRATAFVIASWKILDVIIKNYRKLRNDLYPQENSKGIQKRMNRGNLITVIHLIRRFAGGEN